MFKKGWSWEIKYDVFWKKKIFIFLVFIGFVFVCWILNKEFMLFEMKIKSLFFIYVKDIFILV